MKESTHKFDDPEHLFAEYSKANDVSLWFIRRSDALYACGKNLLEDSAKATNQDDLLTYLQLLSNLYAHFMHDRDTRRWIPLLQGFVQQSIQYDIPPDVVGMLNVIQGLLSFHLGELKQSVEYFDRALEANDQHMVPKVYHIAIVGKLLPQIQLNDSEITETLLCNILEKQGLFDRQVRLFTYAILAYVYFKFEQYQIAIRLIERLLDLPSIQNDRLRLAHVYIVLAHCERSLDHIDASQSYMDKATEIYSTTGYEWQYYAVNYLTAEKYYAAQQYDECVQWCEKSIDEAKLLGNSYNICQSEDLYGRALLASGRFHEAEEHFYRALDESITLENIRYQIITRCNLARLYTYQDKFPQACVKLKTAYSILRRHPDMIHTKMLFNMIATTEQDLRLLCK